MNNPVFGITGNFPAKEFHRFDLIHFLAMSYSYPFYKNSNMMKKMGLPRCQEEMLFSSQNQKTTSWNQNPSSISYSTSTTHTLQNAYFTSNPAQNQTARGEYKQRIHPEMHARREVFYGKSEMICRNPISNIHLSINKRCLVSSNPCVPMVIDSSASPISLPAVIQSKRILQFHPFDKESDGIMGKYGQKPLFEVCYIQLKVMDSW